MLPKGLSQVEKSKRRRHYKVASQWGVKVEEGGVTLLGPSAVPGPGMSVGQGPG